MQKALLPYATRNELVSMIRNFVWGSSTGNKKVHLVAWDRVCCHKDKEGLHIQNLRLNNEAFLMKATFKLIKDNQALRVRAIRGKYGCGDTLVPNVRDKKGCLNF